MDEISILYYVSAASFAFVAYLALIRTRAKGGWNYAGLNRKWLLLVSILITAFILILGPAWPMRLFIRLLFPWNILFLSIANVFGAVVIVELLSVVMPSWRSWSDTKHIVVLLLFWVVLAVLSTIGILIAKDQSSFQGTGLSL